MIVGYKLLDSSNTEIYAWGGIWGQTPSIPNPLILPNDTQVYCAELNVDYAGYTLVPWEMTEAPIVVPQKVSPRQVRLLLLQQGLLDDVEALIAGSDRATQLAWEYANDFERNDPLLLTLATALNLSSETLDQFFIDASIL